MNAVEEAIEAIGSAAALARVCGQKPQAVTRWRRTGRPPAQHCLAIETATGVSKKRLRPDVFGPEVEPSRRSEAAPDKGAAASAAEAPVRPVEQAA